MIYFIQSETGPIKIGHTLDVEQRRKTLQAGNPHPLYVIATLPGGVAFERRLHEIFASGRLVGEWFSEDTPGLRAMVAAARHLEGFPGDIESAKLILKGWKDYVAA